jgi:hypothetical protein
MARNRLPLIATDKKLVGALPGHAELLANLGEGQTLETQGRDVNAALEVWLAALDQAGLWLSR